jgi:hypothetical protein
MVSVIFLQFAGDVGDIGDTHFDTFGTEIKNIVDIFTRNSK